jgi:hypothetical protein
MTASLNKPQIEANYAEYFMNRATVPVPLYDTVITICITRFNVKDITILPK